MTFICVVCDVEYCDLFTMDTRAVGWGLIIHSQDALTVYKLLICLHFPMVATGKNKEGVSL